MVKRGNTSIELAANKQVMKAATITRDSYGVMTLWLRGHDVPAIAAQLQMLPSEVLQGIEERRQDMAEIQGSDLRHLAAERVAGYRQILLEAWQEVDICRVRGYFNLIPKFLSVAATCETQIAKIQGVLTDKVQHLLKAEHIIKMYDFTDTLPPVGRVVEGEVVAEESHLPQTIPTTTRQEPQETPYDNLLEKLLSLEEVPQQVQPTPQAQNPQLQEIRERRLRQLQNL